MPAQDITPKLTLKQSRFVDAYIANGGNAAAAAREAGYKNDHPEGVRLLRNATVRAEIDRLYAQNCLSPGEVLSRLSDQARGIGDYLQVDEEGRVSVDMEALKRAGKAHLVKSVKMTEHGQTIEFYDAQAALRDIGRHHKLFTERHEVTGKDGKPFVLQILRGVSLEDL